MSTKTFHLKNKDGETVGIRVEAKQETFTIPVLDVRRNRKQVDAAIKSENIARGSKFFNPSYSLQGWSYNVSMKP